MKSKILFQLHLISTLLVSLIISPSFANQRLALVIGNSNYNDAPLANPVNDAKAISQKLQNLGFSVTLQNDVNRKKLRQAIRTFGQQLGNDDVGLFYYAGHGMQVNGENYLIPVGSDITVEDEVPDEAVSVNAVLRKMENAKNAVNIVILDACRNNPFKRSFRSSSRGLRRVDGPVGSIIIYATAPGDVAGDGSGANGIFTSYLLQHIETPGLTIHQIMNRVRKGVRQKTNGTQIPWESSALTGDFYFNRVKPVVVAGDTETLFWQTVKQEDSAPFYQKYISRYPKGIYRQQALAAIQRLLGADAGRELVEKADYLNFDKHDEAGAFRLYQQAVQHGSKSAMASLSTMWASGRATGVGKDMQKARYWRDKAFPSIKQLAESGHVFSQAQLGALYHQVDKDYQLALYWYQKAARQESARAQTSLGVMYELGNGVKQSYTEAAAWYRKAAEQGDAMAQSNLGVMYSNGTGVKQSNTTAVVWLRKGAEKGSAIAQANLGYMYAEGKGLKRNDKKAVVWFRKAVDQGSAFGQAQLGVMYEKGKAVKQSYTEAVAWYRKAAKQGSSLGQYNLGAMYLSGLGVKQSNTEAVFWFRKAAEQGNIYAKYDLGSIYAQYNLGIMYVKGIGVEKNYIEALTWFRKAAKLGSSHAQFNLGVMYAKGAGVKQGKAEAVFWFRKAAKQGNKDAQNTLTQIGLDW